MQKKGILIVGPYPSAFGGIAKYVNDLFNSELSQRYELLHLETGIRPGESASFLAGLGRTWQQFKELKRLLKEKSVGLVHIHTASWMSFWRYSIFLYQARKTKAKVLLHIHGAQFKEFFRSGSSFKKKLLISILSKADALVVLSEHWEEFFCSIVPDVKRYVVLNTVRLPDLDFEALMESRRKREETTVLFFGLLTKRKGLVEILELLPGILERENVRVLIAGGRIPGEDDLVSRLEESARKFEERMDLRINVPGEEKEKQYLEGDIFLLPTFAEGLPIALLEAMSFALPVITTPVGAIPEVVEDGKNGFLIQPGDAGTLKEKIDYLLEHADEREKMGLRNLKRVREDFSHESMIKEIDHIYQELLGIKKSSALEENRPENATRIEGENDL